MSFPHPAVIGSSPALAAILAAVARIAPTETTVLVRGETGTGKELVARSVHAQSRRRTGPFVPVSCAALAPGLLAAELFGHEAGAFTGAVKLRRGRFELAAGGTLFLDEIGEAPADAQAALLRVLQERVFERVGGGDPIPADVRVVAATHRDLPAEVRAGRFREDLYYRLNVFPVTVPPLRDRPGDVAALAEHFVEEFAFSLGRGPIRIAPRTLAALTVHDWPGNVRELRNLIERAVILTDGATLAFDPAWLAGAAAGETARTWATQERGRILAALRAAGGRVYGPGGAAQRLGLNPTTLYGKMKKHGIERTAPDWAGPD